MHRQAWLSRFGWQLAGILALSGGLAAPAFAGSGNYLIIAASDYVGSAPLNQFAAAKSAMGFTVSVYSVPAGTSRTAIKAYIQSLWGTPAAPAYILLVGDTDGDPSTASTIPHWTGGGSRGAATDLPYACMDAGDDWYPEIYIGRFSVRTVQQLQDVVNKSLFVEAGSFADPTYVKRATFLASSDTTTQSEQLHDWIISTYMDPAEFTSTRVYANQGGGTAEISAAVNAGTLFLTYFGHSGSGGWSSPGFGQGNVNALTNNGLYGLVMGWSCNSNNYAVDECFGETWLRKANGGAAAYLSASNYVWWGNTEVWESSRRMEKYFYQSFFVDDIWEVRPAWHAALWRLLADPDFGPTHDHTRNIFEQFVLLGDPALLLPRGIAFDLHVTPVSQDLCSPPATQAVFSVAAEQYMGFSEPITLSATGLPAGATVSFSANDLPPPFTSNMTIDGLSADSAGSYVIQITGTAADAVRTKPAGLNVSDSAPAGVTLLTPPDGTVEVLRTPTLAWSPVPQGLTYELEIALDAGFTDLAYTATASGASHAVTIYLDPLTTYYWHVRASNACGTGGFSAPFTFTTSPQRSFFTQLFAGGGNSFDLANHTLALVPDGSPSFYDMCYLPITSLPSNPTGGTPLTMGDDSSVSVTPSRPVFLYGVQYAGFYVCSNGFITFGAPDGEYTESYQAHFDLPRISALFDDLHPGLGGTVSWKEYADRVVVTWENVPEYGTSNSNTFQIEMFDNGEIHINWLGIAVADALAGVSAGAGIPGDFVETDLSMAGPCDWADFAMSAIPATQEVCAQAVFEIEVSQNLGFDEIVVLSATGAPSGLLVSFDVKGGVPPFTCALTVTNADSTLPGEYVIEVVGTAESAQHYVDVGVRVVMGGPPTPVLTSPPDGQTEAGWSPTLTWWVPQQSSIYELQVATDAAFADVMYEQSVTGVSHALQATLDPTTTYYWRVRGVNACGDGAFPAPFSFTTQDRPEYFTQLFSSSSGNFDLQYRSVQFVPDGTGSYYRHCGSDVSALPTDPAGGTPITTWTGNTDDGYCPVTLSGGRTVALYGTTYGTFYVGTNGFLTFTGGDTTWTESLAAHFSQPRVAALFDDLIVGGGTVSWKETADRVAVTWSNVPEYGTGNSNTFQIELLDNGEVHITWLGIAVLDGMTGLSAGQGVPSDYQETDLSVAGACVGDLNCDGQMNTADIGPFVLALTDPAAYQIAFPGCNVMSGDLNRDGLVNGLDIQAFVDALLGP